MVAMTTITRQQIEQRERQMLAPCAALSAESRGREYPQKPHPLRTDFQRDRDRIIHSAAFRRLEYKTQVFIPHEQDHFRTRLTHTIEVAQIGRTLARSLRLNEDLTEAIALVHDLGHTPFGHCGEHVLDRLLKHAGGFNHNRQSLRVVDYLEQRYPEHPGLNLTYEVREGIIKHETSVSIQAPGFDRHPQPTLEAALVDIADEIAYNSHDIDDGLASGLITLDDLRHTAFWTALGLDQTDRAVKLNPDQRRYALVRTLLNRLASDVISRTARNLADRNITTLDQVRSATHKICAYPECTADAVRDLKQFLMNRLYRHEHLLSLAGWAEKIIESLFSKLSEQPHHMPLRFQEMLLTERPEIVIADYIAGMTDRYAERTWARLVH
jgi:dGTPase